ncbi:MAG: hypothetical protein AAGK37_15735 [Pseudomonadota bacterium]
MSKMEELADELAQMALDLEAKTGDENAVRRVADALGTSSTTMEETFLTAIRIRRAERRARELIESLVSGQDAPNLPPKPGGDESGH